MIPLEQIDANLNAVLRASGSSLRNYSNPYTLEKMRDTMQKIMEGTYEESPRRRTMDACEDGTI